eukprot:scaffold150870_cov30-Tisochrysis_lutea.AAC.1
MLAALLLAAGASRPWNYAAISEYVRARAGGRDGRSAYWVGGGTLKRSSGHRIADIDCLERASRHDVAERALSNSFKVERILIYRNLSENRTLLELPAGRRRRRRLAPHLEYIHHVGVTLGESGEPEAVALRPDGVLVARARTLHSSVSRSLFSRDFALQLQLNRSKPIGAVSSFVSVAGIGGNGLPGTVEEYDLHFPFIPGALAELRYRRTGPCPSWCGGGVCTMDLCLRRHRRPIFERLLNGFQAELHAAAMEGDSTANAKSEGQ